MSQSVQRAVASGGRIRDHEPGKIGQGGPLTDIQAGQDRVSGARDVLGHPRGLAYLAGTELWERLSFAGMQALLVLYMVEALLLPGRVERIAGFGALRSAIESVTGALSTQALASQIFGLYVGLVYLLPVFGGLIGDRRLGRSRAVVLGAALMTCGHFCMAFDRSFLLAMLLLILGAGFLRGNLISQVSGLYAPSDPRRATAFQIYYLMINAGMFIAPLVTGVLAQAYGWHYGFGFAGIGMFIGLLVYLYGQRYVPAVPHAAAVATRAQLGTAGRKAVLLLCLLVPVLMLFWIAQTQVWNTYNVWVRDHVELRVGSFAVPVPWLQAFDSLAVMMMAPVVLLYWRRQERRGAAPDDFGKLVAGFLMFALAMAWLACADLVANAQGKVPLAWALGFHILANIGYVCWAPTAVGLYARVAPAGINAMMIGVCYASTFFGSLLSGRIGGLYERLPAAQFWLLHAVIVGAGGVIFLAASPYLRRAFAPGGSGDAHAPGRTGSAATA